MWVKRYSLVCAVLVLLLSCIEKKNNAVFELPLEIEQKGNSEEISLNMDNTVSVQPPEIEQTNSEEAYLNSLNTPLSAEAEAEVEAVREFLYENDSYIKRFKPEITFIKKANFGIPGGDNWIVRLSDGLISVYVIDSNRIEKQYRNFTMDYNLKEHTNFDIMRDIPGTHIPNGTNSIGDFNDDGIDEIFQHAFGGMGDFVLIWFYNSETDDFRTYCSIPFALYNRNGPAPVKFMTYRGMYGFKVSFYTGEVAGGPDYVPESHPDNGKWLFYTWDGEQREYVRVGEVVE
jgi:hypothetical protein